MPFVDNYGKLDWALEFNRTGTFPLDRSTMFSSYADALAYAKMDGTDSRQIGGTAYIGQLIAVYGPGVDGSTQEVAAYIITAVGEGATLQKLAQSSASGDYGEDIANLQAAVGAIQGDITAIEGSIYSDAEQRTLKEATSSAAGFMSAADKGKLDGIAAGAQVNVIEGVAIQTTTDGGYTDLQIVAKKAQLDLSNYATKQDLAGIPKFAIAVVEELPTQDISTTTIYLVSQEEGEASGQDIYDEYIYVNNKWELIGNTDIDLSGYATTEAMNSAIQAAVADMATQTWVTGELADYATTEALTSGLAGKADTTTVSGINGRLTTAEGEIDTLQSDVASKLDQTAVDARIAAATIQASQVSGKVASAAQADNASKVTNALTAGEKTYDGSAAVEITAEDLGALTAVPQATTDALGGIKLGYTTSGNNVAVQLDDDGKAYVVVPEQQDTDTVREIRVNGTQALDTTPGTPLNLVAGSNITITDNGGGSVTIAAADAPTYTGSDGVTVSGTAISLTDGGVTTTKIADSAVTNDKIGAVDVAKLYVAEGDTFILNGGNA